MALLAFIISLALANADTARRPRYYPGPAARVEAIYVA